MRNFSVVLHYTSIVFAATSNQQVHSLTKCHLQLKGKGGDKSGLLNDMVGLLENSVAEVKTVDTLEMTASILDVVAEDADAITMDNQVGKNGRQNSRQTTKQKMKFS